MLPFPPFRRTNGRPSARRSRAGRRPMVQDLEGRQLLSALAGDTLGASPDSFDHRHPDAIVGEVILGPGGGGGAGKVKF